MNPFTNASSSASRRTFLGIVAGAATTSQAGCLGTLDDGDLKSVSYRHRFERSGLASAVNDGGIVLGTWEKEGLDVEFRESSGSQATVQSVQQGEDEFGNADAGAILQAIEEGAELTMIGHVLKPMDGVVALDDSGITTWEDLEEKTVGVFPWSIGGDLVRIAMERNGADPKPVEFQDVQPGAHNTLLRQGEIDANISYWPQSKIRLENEGYDVNTLDIGTELNHLGVGLFTRDAVVSDQPELVNRFVRGWLRAHRAFVTDLDAVIEAHREKVVEFDEELERQTLGYIYASRVPPRETGKERGKGWIPAEKMENTRSILEEIDFIEGSVPIEETYTNEFIAENSDLAVDTAEVYYDELESEYDVEIE